MDKHTNDTHTITVEISWDIFEPDNAEAVAESLNVAIKHAVSEFKRNSGLEPEEAINVDTALSPIGRYAGW